MNYGPLIFLAAFFGLSASWFGLVLSPQMQLGREQQSTNTVNTAELYPQARPGLALQGMQVYRANGCYYCHSQQIGQEGVQVNVVLNEVGTNPVAVAQSLANAKLGVSIDEARQMIAGAPKTILRDVTVDVARAAANAARESGAKANVEILPTGPDIARGWGVRRSVAHDFLFDQPVMLGSLRAGPDLANVGNRLPDADWHLRHLYAPRAEVEGSAMPAYEFLFEKRKLLPGEKPSPDALQLKNPYAAPEGYEVVPTHEARALVAYLLSLKASTPLFEAPMTVASGPAVTPPVTNAPAAMTNAPAAATNSPAQ